MQKNNNRRDAEGLTQIILHTARTLFESHGIDTVSMHQIAKSAQIGQGTLYRRYSNKSDLCMDLMQDSFQILTQEIIHFLESNRKLPAVQKLEFVLKTLIYFIESKNAMLNIIRSSQAHVEPNRFDFFQSAPYQFIHSVYKSLLIEALEHEDITNINPDFTAHMMIESMSPSTYLFLRQNYAYTVEEMVQHYISTFLSSFKR